MKIRVLTSGILATVQDLGRPQWRSNGVPLSGAADTLSHRLTNFLVGNEGSAATLEIAGGGFLANVEKPGWMAVCGAGGQFFVDKKEIGNGRLVFAPKGSELEIRANPKGNFTYLATPGGWDVSEVLGSRSICLSAGFGGFEGRGLRKEDVLSAADSSDNLKSSNELREGKVWVSKWFVNSPTFRKLSTFGKFDNVIRALPGSEFHWWGETQQQRFFNTPFIVSKQRDRMGVRLETVSGDSTFGKLDSMLSTAVAPGTVQVPPDGQPIALLADAQTTGGYPRIAQVVAVDIPRLAQIPTGKIIQFQQVALEEAEELFFGQENLLQKIRLSLQYRWLEKMMQ